MIKRFKISYPLANGTEELRNAYIYLPKGIIKKRTKTNGTLSYICLTDIMCFLIPMLPTENPGA